MTLKASIKSDVSAIFINTDEFAETIVYRFRAGGERTPSAIIDREPPAFYDAAGNVIMPAYMITLADNCTNGVTANEVDTGGDSIELVSENGDTGRTQVTVLKVMENDLNGTITLACK